MYRLFYVVVCVVLLLFSCTETGTDPAPGDIPVNLRLLSAGATLAILAWQPPTDTALSISNYRIMLRLSGQTNQLLLCHTTATNIRLTNLVADTGYAVSVTLLDMEGTCHVPGASLEFTTGLPGWQPAGTAGFSSGMADSLALGNCDGQLVAGFADAGQGYGALAYRMNGSAWEPLAQGGVSPGAAEQLVIPSGSGLSLLFVDGTLAGRGRALRYASGAWQPEGFVSPASIDSLTAIRTPDGLVAAFSDPTNSGRLQVMMAQNGSWSAVGSNASPGAAGFPVLACHEGILYAAYADGEDGWKARVVRYAAGVWETVASGLSAGDAEYLSLIFIDACPYLAFCDGGSGYQVMVKSTGGGGAWTNVGGVPVSSGGAEFSALGIYYGKPVVAYLDNDAGNGASVRYFDGSLWQYFGSAGCTPGAVDGLAFTVLHDVPFLLVSDGSQGYKASVYRCNE